jgi:two-component sensor histidine kinase
VFAVAIGAIAAFLVIDHMSYKKEEYLTLKLAESAWLYADELVHQSGDIRLIDDQLYAGDELLNNNQEIVDKVKRNSGFGCTIFQTNVRIATTAVAKGASKIALGTKANAMVTEKVYKNGGIFLGITETIGKNWVIKYAPLKDYQGNIVGMIATYIELTEFLSSALNFRIFPGATLGVLMLLVIGLNNTAVVWGEDLKFKNRDIEIQNVEINHRAKEKELLLKEIHHRVKNNMQIISSLMALQSRQADDNQLGAELLTTRHRIQSMAMIHEMLYSTGEFSTIDYEKYLKQLINGLVASIRGAESNVEVQIEAKSIRLNMDTAIPLGLLINELVTNSLKYAFPNGAVGNLSIVINHVEPHYTMCISDDGVGFPEDYDFEKASSLGLRLVMNLVTQLEGTLVRGNAKGTRYDITFKKVDSSA